MKKRAAPPLVGPPAEAIIDRLTPAALSLQICGRTFPGRRSATGSTHRSLVWRSSALSLLMLLVASRAVPQRTARAADLTFRNDVMSVLSKAGCNLGVCHGNQNGKGGFKLSLRGQDPQADLTAISRDQHGRRANPLEPDRSLLLLKPTAQIAHQGGRRFRVDSVEYQILRQWIAAGMP